MKWRPVLFCLWGILNARRALGQGLPQRRQPLSQAGFPGGQVFCQWYDSVASGVRHNCFLFFFLTFAKLKQEVLDLRGSNSCRMTGGWTAGWNAATETWQHVGFAFCNWGLRFLYWFHSSERLRLLHACDENQLLTREFPQLSQRCPQRKIESDCSVSEESVKSFSGVWIIGHDSSCTLGGPSERRWKLPPNRWNEQRLQVATHSCAARTRVCCKPHVGIRCNLLEGETGAWVQN